MTVQQMVGASALVAAMRGVERPAVAENGFWMRPGEALHAPASGTIASRLRPTGDTPLQRGIAAE